MMSTEFTADRADERLDLCLVRQLPDLSRSYAQRLIADGQVTAVQHADMLRDELKF